MDLGQEITNHLVWIERIASFLDQGEFSDEDLHEVASHDQCQLGQWLASDAAVGLKGLPEFERLTTSHEAFHQLAGELISALQTGNEANALKVQEDFIGMSREVIDCLQVLQRAT